MIAARAGAEIGNGKGGSSGAGLGGRPDSCADPYLPSWSPGCGWGAAGNEME